MEVKVVVKTDKQTNIEAKKIAFKCKISLFKIVESYLKDLIDGKMKLLISTK